MRSTKRGNGHIRREQIMHDQLDPMHLADYDDGGIDCGIPLVFYARITGDNTVTFTLPVGFGIRVIDIWGIQAGTPAGTINVTDGTNSISGGTIDASVGGDTDRFTTAEIDDAYHEIAGGGTLVVVGASSADAHVYVMALRT